MYIINQLIIYDCKPYLFIKIIISLHLVFIYNDQQLKAKKNWYLLKKCKTLYNLRLYTRVIINIINNNWYL